MFYVSFTLSVSGMNKFSMINTALTGQEIVKLFRISLRVVIKPQLQKKLGRCDKK